MRRSKNKARPDAESVRFCRILPQMAESANDKKILI